MNLFKKKNNINKPLRHDRLTSLSIGGSSPQTDWIITVIGLVVILLILLTWSWRLFVSVNNGTYFDFAPTEKSSKSVIDEDKLERVVEKFEDRAKRFDQLTNGMALTTSSSSTNMVENTSTTTQELDGTVDLER